MSAVIPKADIDWSLSHVRLRRLVELDQGPTRNAVTADVR